MLCKLCKLIYLTSAKQYKQTQGVLSHILYIPNNELEHIGITLDLLYCIVVLAQYEQGYTELGHQLTSQLYRGGKLYLKPTAPVC